MRHNYSLSDETRKVLGEAKLKDVAREMDVDQSHLSHVLAGDATDPFAAFLHLYNAVLRSGFDVSAYDARLAESKARYRPSSAVPAALANKLRCGANTDALIAEAIGDGVIEPHERKPILRAVAVERGALDMLEASVVAEDLKDFAAGAVEARRRRAAA